MKGHATNPPRNGEGDHAQHGGGAGTELAKLCQPLHHRLSAAVPLPVPGRIRETGFTLVELMVSLMIFGMLSAAGVALLTFSVKAQEAAESRLGHLSEWRRASTLMSADLGQAAARLHRDQSGAPLPAMSGGPSSLGFVRRGWENVDGKPRPSLQRVEYRVAGGRLERLSWQMVDGSAPRAAVTMLEGVRSIAFRYRMPTGDWRDRWDPEEADDLPLAVEAVIDAEGHGVTRQLFFTGRGW